MLGRMSVVDKIQHYQRSIEKCTGNDERMLHCISKLYNLPVTVQHLQDTGVGRTVNALRKFEGGVGNAAKALVSKWKAMVADEESSDEEEEDEACVPDAPESYSDGQDSSKAEDDTSPAKSSKHKSEDSKHRHHQKSEKEDGSVVGHNSKHMPKQDSKSRSNEIPNSKDPATSKSMKPELEKTSKHDKSGHASKHESKNDRKSSGKDSKSSRSSSGRHEGQSSKEKGHVKPETAKRACDASTDNNESSRTESREDSQKKRKLDSTNFDKNKSKRRKSLSGESDKDCLDALSSSEGQSSTFSNSIEVDSQKRALETKIKQEPCTYSPKEKDALYRSDIKQEKKDTPDRHQNLPSKSKPVASTSKSKDIERHGQKTEDQEHVKNVKKEESVRPGKESHKSKSHHSSSSSKDRSKDRDRNKIKDRKSEKAKQTEQKASKSGAKETSEKVKIKQEINGDEGIDCNSGASFAEALGMCMVAQSSKKRSNSSPNIPVVKTVKTEPNVSSTSESKKSPLIKSEPSGSESTHNRPSLLAPNVKLEPLNVDLASTLPEISPNYKPLPYINPLHRKDEEKTLNAIIHVKNQRTKVYSGNKSGYTSVPSLYEICIRVLIENIDALEFTGGVPYDIIKPVLERATADQLFMLEHYNPYLIEDTDSLWQFHCSREFRNKQREEMESWREMYMRCLDEREAKLKALTANIKQSIDKSLPVRQTKLAYVDNVVKPPRNVLKKQAKYGTANATPSSTSDLKKKLIAGGGSAAATNISVPPPPMARARTSSGVAKKTKAPLMAKALQLIKGRYKR